MIVTAGHPARTFSLIRILVLDEIRVKMLYT